MAVVATGVHVNDHTSGWPDGADGCGCVCQRPRWMTTDKTTVPTDADGLTDGFRRMTTDGIHPSRHQHTSVVTPRARARAQSASEDGWKARNRAFQFLPNFQCSSAPYRAHCGHGHGHGHGAVGTMTSASLTVSTGADGWLPPVAVPSPIRRSRWLPHHANVATASRYSRRAYIFTRSAMMRRPRHQIWTGRRRSVVINRSVSILHAQPRSITRSGRRMSTDGHGCEGGLRTRCIHGTGYAGRGSGSGWRIKVPRRGRICRRNRHVFRRFVAPQSSCNNVTPCIHRIVITRNTRGLAATQGVLADQTSSLER